MPEIISEGVTRLFRENLFLISYMRFSRQPCERERSQRKTKNPFSLTHFSLIVFPTETETDDSLGSCQRSLSVSVTNEKLLKMGNGFLVSPLFFILSNLSHAGIILTVLLFLVYRWPNKFIITPAIKKPEIRPSRPA